MILKLVITSLNSRINSIRSKLEQQINEESKNEKQDSQARGSGNHGVPASEISFAVVLCLRNMKYLILQNNIKQFNTKTAIQMIVCIQMIWGYHIRVRDDSIDKNRDGNNPGANNCCNYKSAHFSFNTNNYQFWDRGKKKKSIQLIFKPDPVTDTEKTLTSFLTNLGQVYFVYFWNIIFLVTGLFLLLEFYHSTNKSLKL